MIKEKYYISDFCSIRDKKIFKNGDQLHIDLESDNLKDFAKGVYKFLELKYPKFHKMDELCKLGFLASEVLLKDREKVDRDTALVLSNRSSSLDTDRKHQISIQDREDFYPSPAVFVYTLPNIIMGEISIKNNLKSENAFFVTENFDTDFMSNYSKILMNTGKASNVICGWVDLDNDKYDVFLAFLSKKGEKELTKEELNNLYNQ
ncbi:3-oxoacyl-ACP synthase [uncultured Aquimarina sp.]|uniref:3-oxoacyl-ACP synthase n=1 Tax=uncultured Aquimarina sp. TaxID=575652 RepID=UPI00260EE75B|nr:3-oxoacyl-ACP synthase [uncultured Aquimarina sp.]